MSKKTQASFIDPDNYHELCKPVETQEAASNAIQAFWEELYELRNKHKIPDVYLIVRIPVKEIGPVMTTMHAGDPLLAEQMTAWAFGREGADRQAAIASIIERAGAISRNKSK